jgi:hypothetical protein
LSELDAFSEKWNFLVFNSAHDVRKITPEDDESVQERGMGGDDEDRRLASIGLENNMASIELHKMMIGETNV